ncbi:hypoxanthine phosphoribosyltransferase [[Mycoplasma] gypis]|uniref:Hypoxanthine phosphoribosyltransferase n=1 Tax=[Mycoplasma] gypis TaxID=92404 RepID=A0ABZ2RWF9_9BACT|nr:hypoxanthine phosphoribosyltransferase [[Mycoplasma] gypis]MBN0919469.1 hypoxanthine phosphoribosyltransferase [[Mycoplasma] gypis]
MDKRIEKILFSQEQLETRIAELGKWVNEEYKDSKDLIIVGILKGSIPFLAQLIKSVEVDFVMDFMTISSYEGGTKTTGSVKVVLDLANEIENKDVLIVEDIVDTGRTISKVIAMLSQRNPKSLKVLSLLDKKSGRVNNYEVDNCGFLVGNEFVVGFGFDFEEKMRNLPYIGTLKPEIIEEFLARKAK